MTNSTQNFILNSADNDFSIANHLPESKQNTSLPNNQSTSVGEQLDKLFSCRDKKKARYRKNYIAWDTIERAAGDRALTEKTRYISKSAQSVLAVIVQKLEKEEKVFFNHKYLSYITRCERKQNVRIIKQLGGVLEIKYHTYTRYEGRNYSHSYEFSYKSRGAEVKGSGEGLIETFGTPLYKEENNYLKDRSTNGSNFFENSESQEAEIIESTTTKSSEVENSAKPKAVRSANASKSKAKSKAKAAKSRSKAKSAEPKTKPSSKEAKGSLGEIEAARSKVNTVKPERDAGTAKVSAAKKSTRAFTKPKRLIDFHPLSQEDCEELQRRSGKDYGLNAMNEILLSMSKKAKQPSFDYRNGFMAYMTKAYENEMREAAKINNEGFRIRSNQTLEEKQKIEQERYLQEIEYSVHVSPEWHLKKKLACVLEPGTAYALLRSYKRLVVEDGTLKLILHEAVELTQLEREIVLSQAKATHEVFEGGEYRPIEQVEYIMPKPRSKEEAASSKDAQVEIPDTLWGAMRNKLIETYGQDVDRHWFSKLEAKIDEEKKTIDLTALSKFYKDWICSNYEHTMEKIAAIMGISIKILV